MAFVQPFRGVRPEPGYASHVIAPPYDVIDYAEARDLAQRRKWSFLHVSRPEIDLPSNTDAHGREVYDKGAENFRGMLGAGVLQRDPEPCYYVYRLIKDDHGQTGLIALLALDGYRTNKIRRHELTKPVKELDRTNHIRILNAQTSPVLLTYPSTGSADVLLLALAQSKPDIDVFDDQGVRHQIHVIRDEDQIRNISEIFAAISAFYIADGHHRSAAAARVADTRRSLEQSGNGGSYNCLLSVLFPHHQLRILDYNRVISDTNGHTEEQILRKLKENFLVERSPGPVRPRKPMEFGMYLNCTWYRLIFSDVLKDKNDVLDRLDVTLLNRFALDPVFGVTDPRNDPRIDYVGGIHGTERLSRIVDRVGKGAAFTLCPTPMESLMAVADARQIMPPKSTWFEPKLADGLISHMLD